MSASSRSDGEAHAGASPIYLIALVRHRLTLLNVDKLQKIAGFNQDYLHLDGATTEVRNYIGMLERNRH